MRIAITVDPVLPVPPILYGGIERVVDLLVRGLSDRGHQVHLFAHPDSSTSGVLHPYGVPPHQSWAARLRELAQVGAGLTRLATEIDLVHSFGRLAALVPVLPWRLPKIQSYQRAIPWRGVERALRVSRGTLTFTGCSASLFRSGAGPGRGSWHAIFNPVDTRRYRPVASVPPDAPLVFLGRVEWIKGPHDAIAIAQRAGRRLILAGPAPADEAGSTFFRREVLPFVDGESVVWMGPVDDAAKNDLLGRAAALLMPIHWDEPFGIVMAEALACGTPVIGYRRGSVPEVVRDGVTGFVCEGLDQAVTAVARLGALDRRGIREDCEARFGHDVIVEAYLALYRDVVDGRA